MTTTNHREWYRSLGADVFRLAFRNAPAWVFDRMRKPEPSQVAGTIIGTVGPGLSKPVVGADGERLPELISDVGWNAILRQARSTGFALRFRHGGPVIARAPASLTFRLHPTLGLTFEARLSDVPLHRSIIAFASGSGLAVSITFKQARYRHETRAGRGRVRMVDSCEVDSLAITPAFEDVQSTFPAARCYGASEASRAARWEPRARAYRHAFRSIGEVPSHR